MELADFYIIALLLGVAVALSFWGQKVREARTRQMAAMASRLGLAFYPNGDNTFSVRIENAHFNALGFGPRIKNLMAGEYDGCEVALFDFRYATGAAGNRKDIHDTTVCCLWFHGAPFSGFLVRPVRFAHRIGAIPGFQDIHCADQPEFSARYVLQGRDENGVREEFVGSVYAFFAENDGLFCEGSGERLILYDTAPQTDVAELEARLRQALNALNRFRPPLSDGVTGTGDAEPFEESTTRRTRGRTGEGR